ncbi:MAG: outer membrane protein transport protein [Desulfobacterales bacterium]|nr:outer membrane protein transport protein [Desulfobacterales bacterium]
MRRAENTLRYRHLILLLLCLMLASPDAHAMFIEQMAVSARAISLGNACTADPPGTMSIHYNPAGLTYLPDTAFGQGLTLPFVFQKISFEADPRMDPFMDGSAPNPPGHVNPDTGIENGADVKPDDSYPKLDPCAGKSGTSGPRMFLPILNQTIPFLAGPTMGISARKSGSRWTFGYANYAPFAVGLSQSGADNPVRFQAKELGQQHLIYAAPAVSYRVNEKFSLGLSVGMGQTATYATLDQRMPNQMTALTKVLGEATKDLNIPIISQMTLPPPWFGGGVGPYEKVSQLSMLMRDDFSPSYNIGALYKPKEWFSFGVCYQSEIKVEQVGNWKVQYSDQFKAMIDWLGQGNILPVTAAMLNLPTRGANQSGYVTNNMSFPQRVQAGIAVKPFKFMKVLFDINWADWSVLKEDRFIFDRPADFLRFATIMGYTQGGSKSNTMVVKRAFEDTISFGTGLEIMPNDWLTLRLGYEYRPTSVQDELFDAMYAMPNIHHYAAGFGIATKKNIVIDVAFALLKGEDVYIPNNGSINMNSTDFNRPVYNPYAGLHFREEMTAYIASINVRMPISTMKEHMHHQLEMVKKVYHFLNPFDGK